jgi:hypothetical protein
MAARFASVLNVSAESLLSPAHPPVAVPPKRRVAPSLVEQPADQLAGEQRAAQIAPQLAAVAKTLASALGKAAERKTLSADCLAAEGLLRDLQVIAEKKTLSTEQVTFAEQLVVAVRGVAEQLPTKSEG